MQIHDNTVYVVTFTYDFDDEFHLFPLWYKSHHIVPVLVLLVWLQNEANGNNGLVSDAFGKNIGNNNDFLYAKIKVTIKVFDVIHYPDLELKCFFLAWYSLLPGTACSLVILSSRHFFQVLVLAHVLHSYQGDSGQWKKGTVAIQEVHHVRHITTKTTLLGVLFHVSHTAQISSYSQLLNTISPCLLSLSLSFSTASLCKFFFILVSRSTCPTPLKFYSLQHLTSCWKYLCFCLDILLSSPYRACQSYR